MHTLQNPRWERFAQELAKGLSATEAYAAAGYKPHQPSASRLLSNAIVEARVAELQGKAAAKVVLTVADIALQLDEDRQFARELENASAAVSATMGKAKVLGLIVERNEHAGPGGTPIQSEVTHKLDAASADLIANLVK